MSLRFRPETFGGVVGLQEPPLLAHVSRALARDLGAPEQALWEGPEPTEAQTRSLPLSAPTEVHMLLNGRCPARCRHCYVDAGPEAHEGPSTEEAAQWLAALAEMGVFHVALGGGESTLRADLFALAAQARRLGMVPNLTLSGLSFDAARVADYAVFGQVNVSIDGLGASHRLVRGDTSFRLASRALEALLAHGLRAGINHVLTRPTFDQLPELVAWAAQLGACEVEILRLKPAGRAIGDVYEALRLGDEQHKALFPMVLELARAHQLHLKLDCSFGPMIFWHEPDPALLSAFGVVGCDGANSLGAIMPDGRVTGCSFAAGGDTPGPAALHEAWAQLPGRARFRSWVTQAPEPCASCDYVALCQGGCHVVAQARGGGFMTPDPECPRVLAARRRPPRAVEAKKRPTS